MDGDPAWGNAIVFQSPGLKTIDYRRLSQLSMRSPKRWLQTGIYDTKQKRGFRAVKQMMSTLFLNRHAAALVLCALLINGCGYRFTGGGDIPGGVSKIHVTIFENRTNETGIEARFTTALIQEILKNRHDLLTSNEAEADAVLSGVIVSAPVEIISRQDRLTSLQRRIFLVVDCSLNDSSGKIIWSAKGLSDSQEYDVSPEKFRTEANKREALTLIAPRLAQLIYQRLTSDF